MDTLGSFTRIIVWLNCALCLHTTRQFFGEGRRTWKLAVSAVRGMVVVRKKEGLGTYTQSDIIMIIVSAIVLDREVHEVVMDLTRDPS
jgi:hypothetical protein